MALGDFLGDHVLSVTNPSEHGYHHGPFLTQRSSSLRISRINTLICDTPMDASNRMCGRSFQSTTSFYRHLRKAHSLHIALPNRSNTSTQERVIGEDAIRRFVLEGHWKNARYMHEPKKLAYQSLLLRFANEFEEMAEENIEFALKYGRAFHRAGSRPAFKQRSKQASPPVAAAHMQGHYEDEDSRECANQLFAEMEYARGIAARDIAVAVGA